MTSSVTKRPPMHYVRTHNNQYVHPMPEGEYINSIADGGKVTCKECIRWMGGIVKEDD